MPDKQFTVELIDDVIISMNSATAGGHQCLNYLPGSVFLGAIASYLYSKKSPELAHLIFHSGKVRFGNGLPVDDEDRTCYPVPRSWFHDKENRDPSPADIKNQLWEHYPPTQQPKQLRGNYITLYKNVPFFSVPTQYRMKTAIQPGTGLAEESRLFGYSSLPAGSRFRCVLSVDDSVENGAEILAEITDILCTRDIRLGRSRSAEFGTINIQPDTTVEHLNHFDSNEYRILWLLSDCAFVDKLGLPTLYPAASAVGLSEDWQLDLSRSFLYSRSYAPFNARHQRREQDREVLGMGSVLLYCLHPHNGQADDTILEDLSITSKPEYIGLYRQMGLGRVWINPPILDKKPSFKKALPARRKVNVMKEPVNDPLYSYLTWHVDNNSKDKEIDSIIRKLKEQLQNNYKSAWGLQPYSPGKCIGPSATQWGRVYEASRTTLDNSEAESLYNLLFTNSDCICKKGDDQWTSGIILTKNSTSNQTSVYHSTFRDWFEKLFKQEQKNKENDPAKFLRIIALFASEAMEVARSQACFMPTEDEA